MSNASGKNGENAIREAIEAAEAVIDPLDALVEKCKENPGASTTTPRSVAESLRVAPSLTGIQADQYTTANSEQFPCVNG